MIGNRRGVSRILDLKAEGRRFDPGPGHQGVSAAQCPFFSWVRAENLRAGSVMGPKTELQPAARFSKVRTQILERVEHSTGGAADPHPPRNPSAGPASSTDVARGP
jgi:hypothetical protein